MRTLVSGQVPAKVSPIVLETWAYHYDIYFRRKGTGNPAMSLLGITTWKAI